MDERGVETRDRDDRQSKPSLPRCRPRRRRRWQAAVAARIGALGLQACRQLPATSAEAQHSKPAFWAPPRPGAPSPSPRPRLLQHQRRKQAHAQAAHDSLRGALEQPGAAAPGQRAGCYHSSNLRQVGDATGWVAPVSRLILTSACVSGRSLGESLLSGGKRQTLLVMYGHATRTPPTQPPCMHVSPPAAGCSRFGGAPLPGCCRRRWPESRRRSVRLRE